MRLAIILAGIVLLATAHQASAGVIHYEDFNANDGGYTVSNTGNPGRAMALGRC